MAGSLIASCHTQSCLPTKDLLIAAFSGSRFTCFLQPISPAKKTARASATAILPRISKHPNQFGCGKGRSTDQHGHNTPCRHLHTLDQGTWRRDVTSSFSSDVGPGLDAHRSPAAEPSLRVTNGPRCLHQPARTLNIHQPNFCKHANKNGTCAKIRRSVRRRASPETRAPCNRSRREAEREHTSRWPQWRVRRRIEGCHTYSHKRANHKGKRSFRAIGCRICRTLQGVATTITMVQTWVAHKRQTQDAQRREL